MPPFKLDDPIRIPQVPFYSKLMRILVEEFGDAPTYRQAFEKSPREWMRVPGFGRQTLKDLNYLIWEETGHSWSDLPRYTERKTPPRSAHPSWNEYGPLPSKVD